MNKLADYVKYASDYTKAEVLEMFLHLDTIIFMKDFKVQEISVINSFDKDTETLNFTTIDLDSLS